MPTPTLHNFAWNEATNLPDSLHGALVTLLAFAPDRSPALIGTAFIVGAYGNRAIAFSAAHNFHEGVKRVQKPNPSHHLSALREFLPAFDEIAIDGKRLRAIYVADGRVEVCVVLGVLWNEPSDVAIMLLGTQDLKGPPMFREHLQLEQYRPLIGDEVCVLGYADMALEMSVRDGPLEMFTVKSRLVLRAGRIKAVHPEGHILCRGPCIETTIPVFPGMSGGPVFLTPKQQKDFLEPFALISHDPDESVEHKNDRFIEGSAVAALLPITVTDQRADGRDVLIELASTISVRNAEIHS